MHGVRVLVADPQRMVGQALQSLLADSFDLVGTVEDGASLLEAVRGLQPDVVVAEISLPQIDGLEVLRQLRKEGNPVRVVFLTAHPEVYRATEAFRAGAVGYVLKQSAGEELIAAIHEALKGRFYLSHPVAGELMRLMLDVSGHPTKRELRLTLRQREVLQLVAEGKTMKEVGKILGISARTAETHKYEMMHELGIGTTAELIQYAVRIGLVQVTD